MRRGRRWPHSRPLIYRFCFSQNLCPRNEEARGEDERRLSPERYSSSPFPRSRYSLQPFVIYFSGCQCLRRPPLSRTDVGVEDCPLPPSPSPAFEPESLMPASRSAVLSPPFRPLPLFHRSLSPLMIPRTRQKVIRIKKCVYVLVCEWVVSTYIHIHILDEAFTGESVSSLAHSGKRERETRRGRSRTPPSMTTTTTTTTGLQEERKSD